MMKKSWLRWEPLAELSNSVTPVKTGVQKSLKNLDSGWSLPRITIRGRNDAQELLQEAHGKERFGVVGL
jgi:hypothetical protein